MLLLYMAEFNVFNANRMLAQSGLGVLCTACGLN